MKEQLLDYARFNLWANSRMVELFQQQPDEVLHQNIVSSFSSIRDTFLHLWSVEIVWMDRLNGVAPARFMAKTFQGTDAELLENLIQSSKDLIEMVENATDDFLNTAIEFTFLASPDVQRQLPKDIYQHLFNHQTMHRGQLITMGRQAGITTFPRTDYIIWVRENK